MSRKIVITGLGAVTPLGLDVGSFWGGLTAGRSGITAITRFDASRLPTRIAGELKGFDVSEHMSTKEARRTDPFTQYAIAAAGEALRQSGLEMTAENSARTGVVIGSGVGGIQTWEKQFQAYLDKGPGRISPFMVPMMIIDMAPGYVSMIYGARGANFATVSACASGAQAIGEAMRLIQKGDLEAAIAGGTEAGLTEFCMGGFCASKSLSRRNEEPERASSPFDARRDGFVMSEGAGIVIVEAEEHARSRGAPILAELAGYGTTGDAYHMTAPAPGGEGGVRAMRRALDEAGLEPEEIDYINAHGTSTPLNDQYETAAIRTVFGEAADRVAVSSTKSMTGHLLGAAGAVELIIAVQAIGNGVAPPTINYEEADPDCDLDYVPNEAREMPIRNVLSNSLGFGGHNVTLAVKKFG